MISFRGDPSLRRFVAIVAMMTAICVGFVGCGDDEVTVPVTTVQVTTVPAITPSSTVGAPARAVVVDRHPHDPTSFTQGLAFSGDGRLYESAGGYGTSDVREVDPSTGAVLRRAALDPGYFAEGLTVARGELVQLTWKEGAVFRWDLELEPLASGGISGEGWGLATLPDGTLVSSDGSDLLTVRDPVTLAPLRSVAVTGPDGTPLQQLNELEVVGDRVWANVWHSTDIVRIDPTTGRVDATVDLSGLVPQSLDDPEAVLNGIAHRPGDPPGRLWVTGKLWPTLYEIDLR